MSAFCIRKHLPGIGGNMLLIDQQVSAADILQIRLLIERHDPLGLVGREVGVVFPERAAQTRQRQSVRGLPLACAAVVDVVAVVADGDDACAVGVKNHPIIKSALRL